MISPDLSVGIEYFWEEKAERKLIRKLSETRVNSNYSYTNGWAGELINNSRN